MKAAKGRHALARGTALAAVGGLIVLAACEAKVPTAAEIASMDVAALEKKSAQLDVVGGKIAKADYFVNGERVSADSARSIVAAKIGSVEVVKSRSAGRDTILVTTVDRMPRLADSADGYPAGAIARALGSKAVLVIDGQEQPYGIKVPLDPKEIVSIQVMKPGKEPRYPNGLIAIETKRPKRGASAERQPERRVMRTDSTMLRSSSGLEAASRSWSGDSAIGPDRAVITKQRTKN